MAFVPSIARLSNTFCQVGVAIDHLDIWQTSIVEQLRPRVSQRSLHTRKHAGRVSRAKVGTPVHEYDLSLDEFGLGGSQPTHQTGVVGCRYAAA